MSRLHAVALALLITNNSSHKQFQTLSLEISVAVDSDIAHRRYAN
jgi:hypothetical protein